MIYGTTDRRIVEAAARLFVEIGCRVMIGEDPAANRSSRQVYAGFDAEALARRAGAELVDMRTAGYRTVPAPLGREFRELSVSRIALEADLIVSVPLMKSHPLTGVTLTLKKYERGAAPAEKKAFHQRNLSQGIADLSTVVHPGLTIVDAIVASDNWVIGGGVRPMGLVVAGADPVATDAVCCHIMQADPYKVDHLRAAAEMGTGEIDLQRIEVLGAKIEGVSAPFTLPADPLKVAAELGNIDVLVGEACSGCLNRLGEVFMTVGKEKLAAAGPLTVVVGKGIAPAAGRTNILMGRCTAAYRDQGIYLADCAPMTPDVIQAIQYAAGEVTQMRYSWDGMEMASD